MSLTHREVTADDPVIDPCGRPDHPDCGIRDMLDRLGDTWSVLVIAELASGPRRFRALQRMVDGISQRMLTLTLRRLERDGMVHRTVHPTVPPQVEYRLTAMGESLAQAVRAFADWSASHREAIALARHAYDEAHPGHTIH